MDQQLNALTQEFQRQWTENHESADRSLLEQGKMLLARALESNTLDAGIVHTGHDLYGWLGDLHALVHLLRRYLAQPLSLAEEAWARWHLTDYLAMLRQCEESVRSQQDYLEWAKRILPQPAWMLPPRWPFGDDGTRSRTDAPADDCLLIRVMYDATQALCWDAVGKADDWLRIFNDVMASTPATPGNRPDRRYFLRTAGVLLKKARRPQESLQIAERLHALIAEDPTWDELLEVEIDVKCLQIEAYSDLQQVSELRRIGAEATALLEDRHRERASASQQIQQMLYHNTATALYMARQYDLAIPLFRRAMELENLDTYTCLWLAASLWATTRNQAEVMPLLERALSLRMGDKLPLQKAPEFQEVAENAEFRVLFSWETR